MRATFRIKPDLENTLTEQIVKAMGRTMEFIKDDLVNSQTMPFNDGALQGDTFDKKSGKRGNEHFTIHYDNTVIGILSNDVPYSRYQYYGITKDGKPFNYQTANNPYARSHWLEPFLSGKELGKRFAENLKDVREGG